MAKEGKGHRRIIKRIVSRRRARKMTIYYECFDSKGKKLGDYNRSFTFPYVAKVARPAKDR
jgi:hypothetical protein